MRFKAGDLVIAKFANGEEHLARILWIPYQGDGVQNVTCRISYNLALDPKLHEGIWRYTPDTIWRFLSELRPWSALEEVFKRIQDVPDDL